MSRLGGACRGFVAVLAGMLSGSGLNASRDTITPLVLWIVKSGLVAHSCHFHLPSRAKFERVVGELTLSVVACFQDAYGPLFADLVLSIPSIHLSFQHSFARNASCFLHIYSASRKLV